MNCTKKAPKSSKPQVKTRTEGHTCLAKLSVSLSFDALPHSQHTGGRAGQSAADLVLLEFKEFCVVLHTTILKSLLKQNKAICTQHAVTSIGLLEEFFRPVPTPPDHVSLRCSFSRPATSCQAFSSKSAPERLGVVRCGSSRACRHNYTSTPLMQQAAEITSALLRYSLPGSVVQFQVHEALKVCTCCVMP